MLGIIGGSGLTQLANLDVSHREVVRTPYGEPSGPLTFGRINGHDVVFIARHGYGHTIPPHLVNYRANIHALETSGVTQIVSVASVGGIRGDLGPGALVVPHQIIDYTWGREMTFQSGGDGPVIHVDFTDPYDAEVRQLLLDVSRRIGEPVIDGAVYATTQGPRLETAAEINRMEDDGADIVGMTGMPEAGLARELELPYAALCVVANWAAGRADSRHGIKFESLEAVLQEAMVRVRRIIEGICEK
ncbi:S-methyl-5'-thioinosine phosphorylase [Sulfuritalea hydrogenivorans]|jgi:5'-methylthioadenosine phosphorylase|uniref:Probable 6-oxopurine nucleoside phosphorylase n=1 Tax=Sulfuritalea hydrogenivorans sk43H TaxID=1223802 RepID=W0SEP6_9PROT|nr:S-methyl-5'-thioinosine phosphorylase [Sulfuritalea hydrogenivorans]MDK9715530.1 S-methyl-5'-thioinosine phosphorylase [Sulfuritalea sp.]BAO29407.1 putative S-methyl-5'-thioadenosine phosphorylase [Sulfuritalea hydrogenivorans sk43H]